MDRLAFARPQDVGLDADQLRRAAGLPDMRRDNIKLRRAHRPMSAFIDATCELAPLYPPGTQVGYQSRGTAMLSEIVHQVSGKTIQEFVRQEIFEPLGMKDSELGW